MTAAVVVAALCAACTPEEKGRIVVAKGYDVPKAWEPIPVMGRTFYSTLEYNAGERELLKVRPDLAMFDHPWCWTGLRCRINDLAGIDSYTPSNVLWRQYPVKISELCAAQKDRLGNLERFEKQFPDHPITFGMGARPLKILKPSFDVDKADFAQWRKDHPCVYSFYAFDEYDSDSISLTWQHLQKFTHPELRERLVKEYGLDKLAYGYPRKWMVHDYQKAKNFYFGCGDLCGLWSGEVSMAHSLAANGLNFLWYEAEHGSVASPWRWGAAYARGAARQFQIPFGWYTAMFTFNTLTRDGKNPEGLKGVLTWRDSFTYWPNPGSPKTVPHLGASRSLLRRNVRYGYLIGNLLATVECAVKSLYATGADGKSWTLSPYGQDYEELFQWHRHHDRGTVYTPVAMLASMDEGVHRQGYNTYPAKDEASILSFFHTLVPSRAPTAALYCDPQKGHEGCLWNSEFGEILDVLCPDCGQKPGMFERALKDYKAAFLIGCHDPKTCDTQAIANYIADGGTVFCSYDQVVDGLVSASDAGVEFGDKTVLAGKKLLNEAGVAVEEFKEPYTLHVPSVTNAVPFLTDENGSAVAWAANCGKGRVVTVAARRMMPDKFLELKEDGWKSKQWFNNGYYKSVHTGERTFPIVHHLLQRVQRDTMPIAVKGDIQWGLNRTKTGWMLWLINNNGITKFAFEPEDIDLSKTSTVTVDLKDLKGAKVCDVTDPVKTVPLEVKDGLFAVTVKPGEDMRIAIRSEGN